MSVKLTRSAQITRISGLPFANSSTLRGSVDAAGLVPALLGAEIALLNKRWLQ